MWVNEIIRDILCPFVRNTHVQISICPPRSSAIAVKDFAVQEIRDFACYELPAES